MSRSRPTSSPTPPLRRRTGVWVGLGLAAVLVVAAALSGSPPEVPPAPVATGIAEGAGVRVTGSDIALGRVPLNTTVTPTWTIENTGPSSVELGEPHATVEEGCCPGPLVLETYELGPAEGTTLSFPLQMHPGMDGPHRFTVHVPVLDSDEVLALTVTGDFRN